MSRFRTGHERLLEAGPEVVDAGIDVVVEDVVSLVAVDAGLEEGVFASVERLTGEGRAEGDAFEYGRMGDLTSWCCRLRRERS
jgi:hypothetical protein